MNVIPPFLEWLYGAITADAALVPHLFTAATGWRVYEAQDSKQRAATGFLPVFPDNPRYPLLRVTWLSGAHMTGNGGRRFSTSPRLMVEAITDGEDIGEVRTVADRVDALFGERRGVDTNGALTIAGSVCVSHDLATENSDIAYKRLGGIYEFFCYTT